jgi:hypothetical protein
VEETAKSISVAKLLIKDEARRIAANIAKLPEQCAILRTIKPGSIASPQCNISK